MTPWQIFVNSPVHQQTLAKTHYPKLPFLTGCAAWDIQTWLEGIFSSNCQVQIGNGISQWLLLLMVPTRNPVKSLTSSFLPLFTMGFQKPSQVDRCFWVLSFRIASHPRILGGGFAGDTAPKMVGSVQLLLICSKLIYKYPHMAKMFPQKNHQFPELDNELPDSWQYEEQRFPARRKSHP